MRILVFDKLPKGVHVLIQILSRRALFTSNAYTCTFASFKVPVKKMTVIVYRLTACHGLLTDAIIPRDYKQRLSLDTIVYIRCIQLLYFWWFISFHEKGV